MSVSLQSPGCRSCALDALAHGCADDGRRSSLRGTIRRDRFHNAGRIGLRLGQAVGKRLRHFPFDSRCLMRSLVLTRLLAQRGIQSSLVIAVQSESEFLAHAWVEREGVPLLEPAGPPFSRLVEM